MADPLAGFTPQFAALLRGAGIDFSVGDGYTKGVSSPGWGTFTPKDLAAQQSAAMKAHPQTAAGTVSVSDSVQAAAAPRTWGSYSAADIAQQRATVTQLYQQYQQAAALERQRGADVPGTHHSVFSRIMSILSRPGQAAEGLLLGNQALVSANDTPVSGGLKEHLHAAAAGFTGHEHFSFGQALKNKGINNSVITGLGGLAGDIALDPTSYVGLGIAKKAAEAPHAAQEALAIARGVTANEPAAQSLASKLGADIAASGAVLKPRQVSAAAKVGQVEIDKVANQLGLEAARTARASLASDLAKVGMAPSTASKKAVRWLHPNYAGTEKMLAEATPWFNKIMNDPDTLKSAINTTTEKVAAAATERTAHQLTELLHANLAQQVQRSVKMSFAGVPVAKVPIPSPVTQILANASKIDMVGKTVNAFDKVFHTGTRFDNALTVVKARAAGVAQRRIEVGRQLITRAFTGVDMAGRRAWMEALATGPRGELGHGLVTNAAKEDLGDTAASLFSDMGAYIDWHRNGSGLLDIKDLNRYLPGRKGPGTHGHYMKFDKTTLVRSDGKRVPVKNMGDLVKANGDYLRHVDPAKFLYALHVAVEKAVARDQLGRAVREWGVPVNTSVLIRDPVSGRMVKGAKSPAAAELIAKHGYEPIHTGGHLQEASGFYKRHLDGMIFDPEVKKGLLRVIQIADHEEKRAEVTRAFDRVQNLTKKLLTLPSPAFHIRNSFGDFMTGTADGVFGPRGMASYQQALRTMTNLRRVNKTGTPLNDALLTGVDPLTGEQANPLEALAALVGQGPKTPGAGQRVMRTPKVWPDAPGGYLTDAQIWAAYNHAGLNQGFVLGDLGQEATLHGGGPAALGALHSSMDKLMSASAARENFFRLAHFIDRIKRSTAPTLEKAAEDAAYYVRKFHFDYTDVTPIEQSLFARAIPFYKWQRFATPLMLQLFFAKPGIILNWQRAQVGVSQAAGYNVDGNMLPSADQVLPEYFSDAMMYPLYKSSRGNTVYYNPGIPSTQISTGTLGLSGENPKAIGAAQFANAMSSVSPLISSPFELAIGKRVFGGGTIPTGPIPQYLAGRYLGPVANLQMSTGKQDFDTRAYSISSGLGLSENTPGKQAAYLQDLLARIRANRRNDQFTAPTSRGSGARGGGRGSR